MCCKCLLWNFKPELLSNGFADTSDKLLPYLSICLSFAELYERVYSALTCHLFPIECMHPDAASLCQNSNSFPNTRVKNPIIILALPGSLFYHFLLLLSSHMLIGSLVCLPHHWRFDLNDINLQIAYCVFFIYPVDLLFLRERNFLLITKTTKNDKNVFNMLQSELNLCEMHFLGPRVAQKLSFSV